MSEPTPLRKAHLRQIVLEKINEMGDATCAELIKTLNIVHQTVSPRVTELRKAGKIIDTGRKRYSNFGKLQRVYEVAPHIKEKLANILKSICSQYG